MNNQSGLSDEKKQSLIDSRKKMIVGLIGAAIICITLTFLAPSDADRLIYTNTLAVITSGAAFTVCVHVIYRQKVRGVLPRLYLSLGLALGLWFAAESIWAYNELGLGIETPFPSLADGFWLAGYAPFLYFLIGILRNFLGLSRAIIPPVIFASTLGFVLLGNMTFDLYKYANLSTQEGILSYLIASAYPLADMLLLMPAVASLIQLRKGWLTFTPWAFIVIATCVYIVADIGFAFATSLQEMSDWIWVWNPLYNIGDIALTVSLLWHRKFFTSSERQLLKAWQERNR
jgi:hypothetical protein